MFVLFGISAAGVFAKAVADYSEPVRLGIDGGPRLLAVLVPVAMVAGDHWIILRRNPLFWIALLVGAGLWVNLVAAVIEGEALYNKDAMYCRDAAEAAAGECHFDPWLLGSAAVGHSGAAVAIYGTVPALAILGFAGWRRRRPRAAT
jgi:hypothetical protein